MPIELQALSPPDGWAVVRESGAPYLIRPPYRRNHRDRLTEDEVARAMKRLAMRAEQESFAGWSELIRHLEREMVRHSDPRLLEKAVDAGRKLLESSSVEDLHRHLDRLQHRLGGGDWRGTWRALNVLIALDAVIGDARLFDRCRRLLAECAAAKARQLQMRS